MNRRRAILGAAAAAAFVAGPVRASAARQTVEVYRSPSCGCCGAWVDHLRAAGFDVRVTMVDDTSVARRRYGLPDRYGSCHTAVVAGYVVEGHVPAADIRKLLAMKPQALGIAVPGMPVGSPGMEVGTRKDPYQVLLVDRQGRARVFSSYHGA